MIVLELVTYLHKIAVPTVIITAQDDPFIPVSMFDIPAIRHNPNISTIISRYGGHCGFFQKASPRGGSVLGRTQNYGTAFSTVETRKQEH